MSNRMRYGVLTAGVFFGGTVFIVWVCGGFNSVPRPREEGRQVSDSPVRPPVDPTPDEEFIPDEPGEITPQKALDYMLVGKFGRFSVPGIVQPAAVSADLATTDDDAQIVGVGVGGHWRAYCIAEMQVPMTHVINDVVGGVPVTVTYCDFNDCARVFTRRNGPKRPLDVGVGGFWHDRMLLHIADKNFSQSSPEIPLQDLEFKKMTWKKWKQAHPDTDVCTNFEPIGYGPKPNYAPIAPAPASTDFQVGPEGARFNSPGRSEAKPWVPK